MVELEKFLKKKYSETYLNEIFNPSIQKALILETYRGDVIIELFHEEVSLVNEVITRVLLGDFDGMTFHNCNPFFVQLRKNTAEIEGKPKQITPCLRNVRGTVGFVNSKKKVTNSLMDHFYICLKDIPEFDGRYTIFGRVIQGLDVLNKMWDGNTIKTAYVIKNYPKKQKVGNRLAFLFWIGLILALFYFLITLSDKILLISNFEKSLIGKSLIELIPPPFGLIFISLGILLMLTAVVIAPLVKKAFEKSAEFKFRKKEVLKTTSELIGKEDLGEQETRKQKEQPINLKREMKDGKNAKEEELKKKLEEEREKKEEEKQRFEEERRQKKEEKARKEEELKKKLEEERKKIEEEKQKSSELSKYEQLKKKLEEEREKQKELLKKQIEEGQEKRKRLEEENKKRLVEEEKKRKRLEEIMKKDREGGLGKEQKIEEPLKKPEKFKLFGKPKRIPGENEETKKEREQFIGKMGVDVDLKKELKKKNEQEIKQEFLPQIAKRTETQLDVLYDLLENYETLKLSYITKTFNIEKDEALEWCNILVEHGLAELSYPAFGEPVLKKKQRE